MHLITTDLDRTLVFSERSMGSDVKDALCIEQLHEKKLSFVNERIYHFIHNLQQQHFVAVTSRSLEQLSRIQLPIFSQWTIASNGGIILNNGIIDKEWRAIVKNQLQESLPPVELFKFITDYVQQPLNGRLMDGLFYVCRMDIDIEINILNNALQAIGWYAVQNGRKLYILPVFLQKQNAVQYLCERIQFDRHFAAGDSLMDVEMLQMADEAFAPYQSDAAKAFPTAEVRHSGLTFAEYYLQHVDSFNLSK